MALIDRESSGFEKRAGNAVAFLTSLVFHVALLLLLACWVFSAGRPSAGLLLTADIGSSDSMSLDALQTFDLVPNEIEQQPEVTVDDEVQLDVEIDTLLSKPGVGDKTTLTSVNLNDVVKQLKPSGSGRGASFFGAYAEGNQFIYVLDSSRSMTGDRWVYACSQLMDSLNGLKPGQQFFVICFDMQTSFLFNTSPKRAKYFEADNTTVRKVKNWLRSRTLGRATMPAEALRYALNFNPDAIFLLSDGELQDNSRMMLRLLNSNASEQRQVPIHTVHLFSAQGRETLEQIANENSGTFTPIEAQGRFGDLRRR